MNEKLEKIKLNLAQEILELEFKLKQVNENDRITVRRWSNSHDYFNKYKSARSKLQLIESEVEMDKSGDEIDKIRKLIQKKSNKIKKIYQKQKRSQR